MSTNDPKDDKSCLDLGAIGSTVDYGSISYSGGVDTITLDPSLMTTSITVPTSWTTTIPSGGYTISSGASTGYTYSSTIGTSNVNITSNGIDMAAGTDLKIDGKSLKQFMDKMEERLAILVPDPNKLEKFEALKKAYEHYKLMEKLCQEEPTKED